MKRKSLSLLLLIGWLFSPAYSQDAEDLEAQQILDSLELIDRAEMFTILDTCGANIDGIQNHVVKYQNKASALLEIGHYFRYKTLDLYEFNGQAEVLKSSFNVNGSPYITLRGLDINKQYIIKSEDNCNQEIVVTNINTSVSQPQSDEVNTVIVKSEEIHQLMMRLKAGSNYNDFHFYDSLMAYTAVPGDVRLSFIQEFYGGNRIFPFPDPQFTGGGAIMIDRSIPPVVVPPGLRQPLLDFINRWRNDCFCKIIVAQTIENYKEKGNDDELYRASGELAGEDLSYDMYVSSPHAPEHVYLIDTTPTRAKWYSFGRRGPSRYEQIWMESNWRNAPLEGIFRGIDSVEVTADGSKRPGLIHKISYNLHCSNRSGYPEDCGCERMVSYSTRYGNELQTRVEKIKGDLIGSAAVTDIAFLSITNVVDPPVARLGYNTLTQNVSHTTITDSFHNNLNALIGGVGNALVKAAMGMVSGGSTSSLPALAGVSDADYKSLFRSYYNTIRFGINPPVKYEGASGIKDKAYLIQYDIPYGEVTLYPNKPLLFITYSGTYLKAEGRKRYRIHARSLSDYYIATFLSGGKPASEPAHCNYDGAAAWSGATSTSKMDVDGVLDDFFAFYLPGGYDHLGRTNGLTDRTRSRVYPMSSALEAGDIQGNVRYALVNMSGQVVDQGQAVVLGTFDAQVYVQSRQDLPAGMYVLYVEADNGNKRSFKLVKP